MVNIKKFVLIVLLSVLSFGNVNSVKAATQVGATGTQNFSYSVFSCTSNTKLYIHTNTNLSRVMWAYGETKCNPKNQNELFPLNKLVISTSVYKNDILQNLPRVTENINKNSIWVDSYQTPYSGGAYWRGQSSVTLEDAGYASRTYTTRTIDTRLN